jgi:hypothetical protein
VPSIRFLRASERLWKARHTFRQGRLALWRRRRSFRYRRWKRYRDRLPEGHALRAKWWRLYREAGRQVARWTRLRDKASARLALRRRQLLERGARRPRVVRLDTRVRGRFGQIGPLRAVTGHYTAGRADRDDADALRLLRDIDAQHQDRFGDGIAYHYAITRAGTLVLLRGTGLRGTGVAGHNTGNVHVVCMGTTGTRPAALQAGVLRWLHRNAHRRALPASHRLPVRMSRLRALGHGDWPDPGGATSCPGGFRRMYLTRGRDR